MKTEFKTILQAVWITRWLWVITVVFCVSTITFGITEWDMLTPAGWWKSGLPQWLLIPSFLFSVGFCYRAEEIMGYIETKIDRDYMRHFADEDSLL